MTKREQYEKAFKEHKEAEKKFNDMHRELKHFKQTVLLPSGRYLTKLERELYKK